MTKFSQWFERLERIGFKVVAVTADGASPNRKVFHMHSMSNASTDDVDDEDDMDHANDKDDTNDTGDTENKDDGLCYKSCNPYTNEKRSVFFFSDVPHLMKTTRNCWSHSSKQGSRNLWVCIPCMYTLCIKLETCGDLIYVDQWEGYFVATTTEPL